MEVRSGVWIGKETVPDWFPLMHIEVDVWAATWIFEHIPVLFTQFIVLLSSRPSHVLPIFPFKIIALILPYPGGPALFSHSCQHQSRPVLGKRSNENVAPFSSNRARPGFRDWWGRDVKQGPKHRDLVLANWINWLLLVKVIIALSWKGKTW